MTFDALDALIANARRGGARARIYREADGETRHALATWVSVHVAAPSALPSALGHAWKVVTLDGERSVLLENQAPRGGGVYAFRAAERAEELSVHVPHSFWDQGTLPLGIALFEAASARALLVNTVHRYHGAGCPVRPSPPRGCASDVAHSERSSFHAVHQGLRACFVGDLVMALHGFADISGGPDAIVSAAGTTLDVAPFVSELRRALPRFRITRYPDDFARLGGTRGAQARDLRQAGGAMLHLELSHRLRGALVGSQALRDRFIHALRSGLASRGASEREVGSPP